MSDHYRHLWKQPGQWKRFVCIAALIVLTACTVTDNTPPAVTVTAVTTTSPPPPIAEATATATYTATATPAPQLTATPTSILINTPTPSATPTAIPPPTLPPTADPWVQLVNSEGLPSLPNDLLFLADGSLRLWPAQSGEIVTILAGADVASTAEAGHVVEFDVSDDGRIILAARTINANPSLTELLWHNLDSGETGVVERVTDLRAFALSPDGQRAAFIQAGQPSSQEEEERPFSTIHLAGIGSSTTPTLFRSCPDFLLVEYEGEVLPQFVSCAGIAWSPDSQNLLWGDGEGAWTAPLDGNEARLLVANRIDPAGTERVDFRTIFRPTKDWSANGRFLRLAAYHFEGGSQWVLDWQTGQVFELPNSSIRELGGPYPQVRWTTQNDLFLTYPAIEFDQPPILEILRLGLAEAAAIVQASASIGEDGKDFVDSPAVLANGQVVFALLNSDPDRNQVRGLYSWLPPDPPQKMMGLPPLKDRFVPGQILWLPDGSGAIYIDAEKPLSLYLPTPGDAIFDLTSILNPSANAFYWLPENG